MGHTTEDVGTRRLSAEDLDWPWYLPWGSVAGVAFVAVEAIRHRAVEWGADALWVAVPLILVATVPFFLDFVGHYVGRFLLHRIPWATLTLGPVVAVLVHSPTQNDFAPFLLVIMCIQGSATAGSAWQVVVIALAVSGSMLGLEAANQFDGSGIWVVGALAATAGGYAVRMSVEALKQEKVAQESRMEKATTDERQRIAREIHDVIAHSLSVTMLHLTGARRALEEDGPTDDAVAALRDAEALGRQAMTDIRRTVGLLEPGSGDVTRPMPGAGEIAALCESFRSAGVDVTFERRGGGDGLSLATGLGLYRIAQESLANVVKHAPGAAASVSLDLQSDPVSLSVRSGRGNGHAPVADAPDVGGLGVKGIEERVRLLGGRCRVGPDGDGWLVEVSAPRSHAPG